MMGNYVPSVRVVRSMYSLGTQENLTRNGYYRTAKNLHKEFDSFIAKVKADALREHATWVEGGTPRAWGFHHPCDPPGVVWTPTERDEALLGVVDTMRDQADRIEREA